MYSTQAQGGGDCIVAVPDTSIAGEIAARLSAARVRVITFSAAYGQPLTVSALLAAITGEPDLAAQDDELLKRGFEVLTHVPPGVERTVLLMEGGAPLHRGAARYLDYALRIAPHLTLTLVGEPGAFASWGEGSATLAGRLARAASFAATSPAVDALPAAGPVPGIAGSRRRRAAGWAVAASVCLVSGGMALGYEIGSRSVGAAIATAAPPPSPAADLPGEAHPFVAAVATPAQPVDALRLAGVPPAEAPVAGPEAPRDVEAPHAEAPHAEVPHAEVPHAEATRVETGEPVRPPHLRRPSTRSRNEPVGEAFYNPYRAPARPSWEGEDGWSAPPIVGSYAVNANGQRVFRFTR